MPNTTGRPGGFRADGPRLRQIRLEHGVTVAAVTRIIGCDRKTVERAEQSWRISKVTAWRIANALSRHGDPVRPSDFMAEWPEDGEQDAREPAA